MQWDVDQHDGAEDGRLVGKREGMCLILQKSAVVSEAVDVGNEDDSEKTKRRTGRSSHLWCSKMATTMRET